MSPIPTMASWTDLVRFLDDGRIELGLNTVERSMCYLHAHLALKEAALIRLKPYESGKRPNDRLLAFLEAL